MPPKAVLCGYYGQGNGGDEALLATVLQMLPTHWQPIVLSGDRHHTAQQYGVESCDRRSAFQILHAFKAGDAFIWGGGSLMQDATSWASPIYYGGLMGLAQQKGLTTLAWAQGIGPLNRTFTRWLTRQALSGCAAITVRDPASAALVEQWGLPCQVAPDPVWALDAIPWTGEPFPKNSVAVTLRPHATLTPERLTLLTQAIQSFQEATQTHIVLLPFQKSQDLAIAKTIAQTLTVPHQIVLETDPRKLKSIFQQMRFAIGMRLHSLIMAAAECCPCFALSYDPKVTQLMAIADLPGYELSELPTDAATIVQDWCHTLDGADPAQAQHRATQFHQQAQNHQQILRQVLSQV